MTLDLSIMVALGSAGIILVGILIVYNKLSAAIDRLSKQHTYQANNGISQIEALLALYADIRPEYGLPKTRGWAGSPDFLRLIASTVIERKPQAIVECSSGISTLVLAGCLKRLGTGKVFSLEHDPVFAEKTRKLLRTQGLENWATVIDAPLVEINLPEWQGRWYDLKCLDDLTIDMLVVDGPPESTGELARYPAIPMLRARLGNQALIVLDDANRSGEKETVDRWLREDSRISHLDRYDCEKGAMALIWKTN